MVITVKPYGFSGKQVFPVPENGKIKIPEGTTLDSLLRQVGVSEKTRVVVIVNGRHRGGDYLLQPGDDVTFFPPLEGG